MEQISCEVVRDLLPLCADGIAGADTQKLAAAHLEGCSACRAIYEGMKESAQLQPHGGASDGGLARVSRELASRRLRASMLAALLALLLALTVFARLVEPRYCGYSEGLITVSKTQDGSVFAVFDEQVTSVRTERTQAEWDGGGSLLLVEAWSCPWDRIIGKGRQMLLLSSPEEPADSVLYCTNGQDAVLLWGKQLSGGLVQLPRLVLGYYLCAALALAAVLGLAWLLLRKTRFAGTLGALACIPASYALGHLCIKGISAVSFNAAADLLLILLAAAAAYGALRLALRMLRTEAAMWSAAQKQD